VPDHGIGLPINPIVAPIPSPDVNSGAVESVNHVRASLLRVAGWPWRRDKRPQGYPLSKSDSDAEKEHDHVAEP
jgi:hypothetical protein